MRFLPRATLLLSAIPSANMTAPVLRPARAPDASDTPVWGAGRGAGVDWVQFSLFCHFYLLGWVNPWGARGPASEEGRQAYPAWR